MCGFKQKKLKSAAVANFRQCQNYSETFFLEFHQLKWLDLRNNYLTCLPTTGLSSHSHLQDVLLKSNLIKIVPPELGSIIILKGLQLADNPVENIPFEVISAGFPAVISHLRKLNNDPSPLLPVSETLITNSSQNTPAETIGNECKVLSCETKPGKSNLMECLQETLNIQSYSKHQNQRKKSAGGLMKNAAQVSTACRRLSRSTVNSYSCKLTTPEKIRFHELEQQERAKLKETLTRQAQMLQRIKDTEAVKSWRKVKKGPQNLLDNFQYSPSRNFIDKSPFDVDADMLKMLNRVDLYKSIRDIEESERRKVRQSRNKPPTTCPSREIESQMNDIRLQLEKIDLREKIEQLY